MLIKKCCILVNSIGSQIIENQNYNLITGIKTNLDVFMSMSLTVVIGSWANRNLCEYVPSLTT